MNLEPRQIGLDYPASSLAQPPIRPDEALNAPTAVCRYHDGRIRHTWAEGDRYGNVYFCPIGQMYWRLNKHQNGFLEPLSFPKGL